MSYVQNDDGTPLGYTVGIVQTQGSSLREQPWALRRNSVGVEERLGGSLALPFSKVRGDYDLARPIAVAVA